VISLLSITYAIAVNRPEGFSPRMQCGRANLWFAKKSPLFWFSL